MASVTLQPTNGKDALTIATSITTYGTATFLYTGKSPSGNEYLDYLYFDISSYIGKPINSATLSLYRYEQTGTQNYTQWVKNITSDWSEDTITGSNSPSVGETKYGSSAKGTNVNAWVDWDITTLVSSISSGTTSYGFCVGVDSPATDKIHKFYSSENAVNNSYDPKLTLSYDDTKSFSVTTKVSKSITRTVSKNIAQNSCKIATTAIKAISKVSTTGINIASSFLKSTYKTLSYNVNAFVTRISDIYKTINGSCYITVNKISDIYKVLSNALINISKTIEAILLGSVIYKEISNACNITVNNYKDIIKTCINSVTMTLTKESGTYKTNTNNVLIEANTNKSTTKILSQAIGTLGNISRYVSKTINTNISIVLNELKSITKLITNSVLILQTVIKSITKTLLNQSIITGLIEKSFVNMKELVVNVSIAINKVTSINNILDCFVDCNSNRASTITKIITNNAKLTVNKLSFIAKNLLRNISLAVNFSSTKREVETINNTALWDIQKSLVSVLTSSTSFTDLVGSSIFDEPPTNQNYPYVVITTPTEISDNTLTKIGFESTISFFIYTKPEGLGWYTCYKILDSMNAVLNIKKPTLDNLNIVMCKMDQVLTEKIQDKRILIVRYRIWSEKKTTHTI
jgi:hypothetical protein